LSLKNLMLAGILALAGVSVARTQIPECRLCGTWVLVDRIDRTAAGQVLEEPNLGADPIGIIVYDRAGNVSAQLMKRHHTDTTATPQGTQATNNSSATGGYDAYFGKYEVDTKAHTVTHHLIGAIALGDIGKSLTRSYEFVGGELRLSFETTNNVVPVRRTVRFRRAAGPPN
jgi:hypothetical protein